MIDPRRRFFLRGRLSEATAPRVVTVQRPPWSVPEARFTELCSRCHACVNACPRQVLAVGDGGFPQMNFSQQGCDLCGACATVCEPQAINRTDAEKHHPGSTAHAAWPGWALAVSDQCLAKRRVECRACGDICDRSAIRFRPAPGGIAQMQLNLPNCTGCGECVGICPAGAVSITATDSTAD